MTRDITTRARWTDPETGSELQFHEMVERLLVAEYGKSQDEAKALVHRHSHCITQGIFNGMNLRATAMAIEMAESRRKDVVNG